MLVVRRTGWDAAAAADLGRIVPSTDYMPADFYEREAAAGGPLLAVEDGGRRVGTVLLRFEGPECVIVGAGGRWPGGALAPAVLPVIEAEAERVGLASIRFHTARPGLVRFARRAGYRVQETVMQKNIGGGHGV